MKNIFLLLIFILFSFSIVNADNIEDDSIINELNKQEVKQLDFDFKLKSFNSCEGLENVMWKYIKDYWENNKKRWIQPVLYKTVWAVDMIAEDSVMVKKSLAPVDANSDFWMKNDFSKTNTQVDWVDESDIVKTDWNYIYYYNDKDKFVYIVKANWLEIIKKIKLPNNFNRPVLYIAKNRLVIVSSWYSDVNYFKFGYFINRNSKTYTIVFDTTNIKKPILTKLYISDWNLRKTRKIGNYLYVISNNSFNIPYRNFKSVDDIKIDIKKIMPTKIDISKTSDKKNQNLKFRWKKLPYNIESWNIAKCNEIEYVLPDENTLKKYDFNPSYNIISVINIKDTEKEVKTKVIAGSNAELYMSLDNMYLTSYMYQANNFSCPEWMMCILPWYPRWRNTLVHKINVSWDKLKYQDSTIVPGSPLTQYSMDEYKWDFRILTKVNNWSNKGNSRYTNLYILDKNLKLKWSLKNLGSGEDFKSSRYIWNKLYLVTFKQIDPLFVIDMSDSTNPKVLGELKIPGYSTYLHPYDENHLIGLGFDTTTNKWWGTVNNGLKIDLYDVSDFKNPKQKYSYILWEYWSYSEALTNPRMFMWKSSDNKLFLPATLYKNDKSDQYRHIDFFQWLVVLDINKDKWIKEDFRITHIDKTNINKKRIKECSKYTVKENKEPRCHKLLNWWEYCEPVITQYIPKYCYADSSIWEYIASKSWEYRNGFIKRALWINDNTYSISNNLIKENNINTWVLEDSINLK